MNENETDPRRADASGESSSPQRGQSDEPTAAQPPVAQPAQPAAPPAPPVGPEWGRPESSVPQSSAPYPGAPQSGVPQSGVPQSGVPQSGSPWQQPQQPPWQHGGYQYPQQPGYQGYPPQQPQPAYAGGWSQTGGDQGQPPPIWAAGDGQPSWAQPVDQKPPSNGRGRKTVLAATAALLIALVAGGAGAAGALALSDDDNARTVQSSNSAVTRVVDRSSLAQIASAVQDSVVSITTQSGEGSGVVLTPDGYIVTNNHVVATATGDTVTVIFADGKKATAKIVGTDPRTDLAVVKANDVSGLQAAKFGSSANMQVGDTVLAIGSPLGLEGSVTAGIISAKDRTIQSSSEGEQPQSPYGGNTPQQQSQAGATTMSGLLQTDAPINPGNSGGALVNTNGELIGINSAIATQGQGSGNIGLGFAIPSDKAKQVADDLMAGRKVSHPALGVSVTPAENGGALVSNVTKDSAAAKAGLQQGDVITQVDGKNIGDSDDLVAVVQAGSVGQKMTINYTRSGAQKTATVTLSEAQ